MVPCAGSSFQRFDPALTSSLLSLGLETLHSGCSSTSSRYVIRIRPLRASTHWPETGLALATAGHGHVDRG